jgi:hypothetical protein
MPPLLLENDFQTIVRAWQYGQHKCTQEVQQTNKPFRMCECVCVCVCVCVCGGKYSRREFIVGQKPGK